MLPARVYSYLERHHPLHRCMHSDAPPQRGRQAYTQTAKSVKLGEPGNKNLTGASTFQIQRICKGARWVQGVGLPAVGSSACVISMHSDVLSCEGSRAVHVTNAHQSIIPVWEQRITVWERVAPAAPGKYHSSMDQGQYVAHTTAPAMCAA
jgi:hypothetical protein